MTCLRRKSVALSHNLASDVTPQGPLKYIRFLTVDCSYHLIHGGTLSMVSYTILTRLSELLACGVKRVDHSGLFT